MIWIALAPTSNKLEVCVLALQEVHIWISCVCPNFQENMQGQGMCEMHMHVIFGKK
jgi:hypothetical protein